ncbi:hypothetical protein RQP46_011511 [Phenoliferia psychrophenolica]
MDSAAQAKEKGNVAFKAGNFPLALTYYSTAIRTKSDDPTFYLNRAAVYLKLDRWAEAEKDATKTIELAPKNAKALFRRAVARRMMGALEGAKEDLDRAKTCGGGPEVDKERELLDVAMANVGRKETPGKPTPQPKAKAPSPPRAASPPTSTDSKTPSTSRLRAAISPPVPSTENGAKNGAPANEFMNEVSTRRTTTPSSFAAKKADRETRLAATAPLRPKIESIPSIQPEELNPTTSEADVTPLVAPPPAMRLPSLVPLQNGNSQPTSPKPPRPLFPPHTAPPTPLPSTYSPNPPSLPKATSPAPSNGSITTSSGFESAWSSCPDLPSRRTLLFRLDSTRLPQIFGDRLEPDLFSEIVAALGDGEGEGDWLQSLRLLEAFPRVRRFSTAVAFLEEGEKVGLRALAAQVRKEMEKVASAWEL